MLNREVSLAIQQAFSKPCLINLISKDAHLVFSMSHDQMDLVRLQGKLRKFNKYLLAYVCRLYTSYVLYLSLAFQIQPPLMPRDIQSQQSSQFLSAPEIFNEQFNKNSGHLGDNCVQIFHLGRYIVGYTVGNLVLRQRASGAIKRDFRTYSRRYTSTNETFEYGNPHSNALLQFHLKFKRCKPHKAAHHPTICDIINDVKLFSTVYYRIYCRKFLTLSNQKSRYKSKCIRMLNYWYYYLKTIATYKLEIMVF